MTKHTIETPDTYDVQSRGQSVTCDMEKLSPEIVGQLAIHGLRQKVADAASGITYHDKDGNVIESGKVNEWKAKNPDEAEAQAAKQTQELMAEAVQRLVDGEWIARGEGGPADEHAGYRKFIRQYLRAQLEVKGKAKGMKVADLDELFDAQSDDVQAAIVKKAKAMRKATLEADIDVSI